MKYFGKISFYCLLAVLVIPFVLWGGVFVLDDSKDYNLYEKPAEFVGKGMGAYIINIKNHKEKYNNVHSQLSQLDLPIHRVDAVDAGNMKDEEIKKYVDIPSYQNFLGHNPRRGTVGCYLSHIKAWQEFLRSDYEFALITEDDIEFNMHGLKSVLKYLVKNKNLWDLNKLETLHYGFPLRIKKFQNGDYRLSVYLFNITNSAAYLINRKTAHSLLKKALPIKMPLDHYFLRGWELDNIVITGIEPRIGFQSKDSVKNSYRKSIGYIDNIEKKNVSYLSKLRKKVYVAKTESARFIYNLIQYVKAKYKVKYAE